MRIVAVGALCLAVAACDTPNFKTSQFQFGESRALATSGSVRLITERNRPLPYGSSTVVCTEPSPDYSTAVTQDVKATVKSTSTQSPISELSGESNTTETITKGDGRSKGVLALRDGLYAACQAYANGTIGKDAYSIILSQYGILLVALMQDDTYAGAAGAPRPAAQVKSASPFAAMVVSCINQFDPTRKGAVDPGGIPENRILTVSVCRKALNRAAGGTAG